ncbi:DUF2092 domain-containing protein [Phenylobacterium sp. LjRoot219]|uniref:DUF2092 domain-containing protein n=1 Tax=Phenylobacterium sp. LjRoot219 TaxID=3342283 RepID=UPI003ED0D6BC
MTPSRRALTGLALALTTGAAALAQATAPATPSGPDIEPEAVQALQRMNSYLGTLTTFEATSDTTQDVVLDNGQKVQIDGVLTYRVKRPDGFEIKVATGNKVRDFYYNGKQLTVYAPKLGYYAQAAAPPTIRQTLDAAHEKYGIVFPLEELFRWSEPGAKHDKLQTAMVVGDAVIGGVQTTQYAFREGDYDWEVWIEKGARPLPRKVVIVDRSDDARPAYTVRLGWNLNAPVTAESLTFKPGKNDKPIQIAAQ